ncbi:MAG: hypothetical protein IKS54_10105 [Erysipelotrichaceae bacterium]|nr:hypothetical protein [Erysipelotrichaceae bacterium]
MKQQFTIETILIDTELNNEEKLFVEIDTLANRMKIYENLNDFPAADYHVKVKSDLLVNLVDQLGGIIVDNKKQNGKDTLKLLRENRIDAIVEAIGRAFSGKNLLLTLPSMLSSLNEYYSSDIPFMDIVKTILSEVNDLKDWKAELIS